MMRCSAVARELAGGFTNVLHGAAVLAPSLLFQRGQTFSSTSDVNSIDSNRKDFVRERVLLHGVHDLPAEPHGIIEMRQYQLQPSSLKPYLQVSILIV